MKKLLRKSAAIVVAAMLAVTAAPATYALDSKAAVASEGEAIGFLGEGTATSPYILKSDEDLVSLSTLVSEGNSFADVCFKFDADITLPENWSPIGNSSNRFSGSIDGNNHLLKIPKGEKTMLGVTKQAKLSSLNIFGEEINGNGVVDTYTTGANNVTCIEIDNVTLKAGTKTLKSGFVGGYASGSHPIYIKNCTVEKGVVIGYTGEENNIGSFGGDFNGYITDCVSYATVKGVNYVGGICGNKGQTMGSFDISGNEFYGTVEATGSYVGGIAGNGYGGTQWGIASGPNTPCGTIKNNIVYGNVEGANHVGGIYGGEAGVKQCWNNGNGYIQNNFFGGKVSATEADAYLGAIVGYINVIDSCNIISNNYYLADCGATKGVNIGGVDLPKTEGTEKQIADSYKYVRDDDIKAGDDPESFSKAVDKVDEVLITALNTGANSNKAFELSDGAVSKGASKYIASIATTPNVSGSSLIKLDAHTFDFYTFTATYNDGTVVTKPFAEAELNAIDYTKPGYKTCELSYDGALLAFRVNLVETVEEEPTIEKAGIDKDGKIVVYCKNCKKDIKTTVIPKIAEVKLNETEFVYDGNKADVNVIVTDSEGSELSKDTDYTVEGLGENTVGAHEVKVTFIGNYEGETTLSYTINAGEQKISAKTSKYTFIFNPLSDTSKAVNITGAKGALSYKSGNKNIKLKDGKIVVAKNTPAGTYEIKVKAKATADGSYKASNEITLKVVVNKANNPARVTPATKTIKAKSLKSKAITFNIEVKNAKGKVTYKSGNRSLKVTKAGKVTVAKGTKKGTYKLTVNIAGNANYKSVSKIVKVIIK